jgi:hypothetical protein
MAGRQQPVFFWSRSASVHGDDVPEPVRHRLPNRLDDRIVRIGQPVVGR